MRIALCDDNEQDLNYYSDLICTLAKEKNIAIEIVRFETGEQALFHISNNEKPIFYCWMFICPVSMELIPD